MRRSPFSFALALSLLGCPAAAQEQAAALTPRQRDVLAGIARYAPWDCPDRWLYELGPIDRRGPLLRERLLAATSWIDALAYAVLLEWDPVEAARTADALLAALPQVTSGKARQNVIFLIALTAPDAAARLRPLFAQGADLEDRADAGCALAALGDPAAIAWFVEAFSGSEGFRGRRLFRYADYQRLEQRGDGRPLTRSYRTFEVLLRRPYFRRLGLLRRVDLFGLRRADASEAERRARVAQVLPAFPAKWPAHPGSDDFANHLASAAIESGDRVLAYRWLQRASLLPDQDVRGAAVDQLTALADSQLTVEELDALLDSSDGEHNRDFLRYTRFLALARRDLGAGLAELDRLAAADPAGPFARARRAAAHQDVPAGLRAGVDEALTLELLLEYPVRSRALAATPVRVEATPDARAFLAVLTDSEREVLLRTQVERRDSVALPEDRLARQVRTLVEVAELARREAAEPVPARRADLRLRRAQVLRKAPWAFFPAWANHHMSFGQALARVRYDAAADQRLRDYVSLTFAHRRAAALLEDLVAEHPDYAGRDRALFAWAMCVADLLDYRPAKGVGVWVFAEAPGEGEGALEHGHRRAAELFERLAQEHPASPLADDAARAAEYRRRMQRQAALGRAGAR